MLFRIVSSVWYPSSEKHRSKQDSDGDEKVTLSGGGEGALALHDPPSFFMPFLPSPPVIRNPSLSNQTAPSCPSPEFLLFSFYSTCPIPHIIPALSLLSYPALPTRSFFYFPSFLHTLVDPSLSVYPSCPILSSKTLNFLSYLPILLSPSLPTLPLRIRPSAPPIHPTPPPLRPTAHPIHPIHLSSRPTGLRDSFRSCGSLAFFCSSLGCGYTKFRLYFNFVAGIKSGCLINKLINR